MIGAPVGSSPTRSPARVWLFLLVVTALLLASFPTLLRPPLPIEYTDTPDLVNVLEQGGLTHIAPAPAPIDAPGLLPYPELTDLRGPYTRHYDQGNGQYLALVSPTPLHYQDILGNWQPINADFTPVEGGWQVQENSLRSTVAERATAIQLEHMGVLIGWEPQALQVRMPNATIRPLASPLTPDEAAAATLAEDARTLTYAGVWSDPTITELLHSKAGALKQELVLTERPRTVAGGQWLELHARITIPEAVVIYAEGQTQTAAFSTEGAVELRTPGGETLLTLAPPVAYEQANPGERVGGRYHLVHEGRTLDVYVQTPWAWWAAADRTYPAVLDPTMQVLRTLEQITIQDQEIGKESGIAEANANVFQSMCPGHFVTEGDFERGFQRSYVKFPLPTLPNNVAVPQAATLVAVPERNSNDPTYTWYSDKTTRMAMEVYRTTEDWSGLLSVNTILSRFLCAFIVPRYYNNGRLDRSTLQARPDPDP
ncbi:MAG: hypothetical protein HC893_04335 [Chloroflexaceae bacterium]|nr:hypothetical protein [Chloroflexaceae bacterium]